jgi:hypothetical protein
MLSDWVSHGDLKDPREEFFIKENLQLNNHSAEAASEKAQWKNSFVFRSIDLKQFFQQGGSRGVELSIPIFLRPQLNQILSTGKSLRIIKYLDTRNHMMRQNID